MRILTIFLLCLLCVSAFQATAAGSGQARRMVADSDHESGARLIAEYCSACHRQPAPAMHFRSQWPAVVARMVSYIHSRGMAGPDPRQEQLILQYLEQNARG